MTGKRETKSGKWQQGSFSLDETRSSQRKNALRIRKERKAVRLREKRGLTLTPHEQERLTGECTAILQAISSGAVSAETFGEAHRLVSKNSDVTANTLQQLLDKDSPSARMLMTRLLQPNVVEASIPILYDLTLALATSKLAVEEASYYGRAPLQWKQVFFPEDGSESIIDVLLKLPQSKALFESIGNIVQYAPDAAIRCIVPQFWGQIAGALHHGASYAVAAILRADMTHFGMDLIQAMDRPLDEAFLKTNDGMWILQGLSRREQACVDLLRNNPAVCNSLRSTTATATDPKILIPALQALTNLEIPCDDVLLHVRTILDSIPAAVVCTAKEKWIVRFIDLLVDGSVSHAWKLEIVFALAEFRECVVESFWRDELMDPLVGLTKVRDTAEPAIAILDRALRCAPHELRVTFEATGGIELLEERAAEGYRMAEALVDDLFADDDGGAGSFAGFSPPPPMSTGRGRGKPTPAWMTN